MINIQMLNSEFKRHVLIGSSGAGNAYASAMSIRRNWGDSVKIVGMDTNEKHLVTLSLISDCFYKIPEVQDPLFEDILIRIVKDENIETYIPLIDHEIFISSFLFNNGKLGKNLNLQVKDSNIAEICNDKYKSFIWLCVNNIPTPLTYLQMPQGNCGKLVLKMRTGFGTSVTRISNLSDYKVDLSEGKYIIQQACERPEITIDVCYDKTRQYYNYVCRERIETKAGVCTKARLFYNDQLAEMGLEIAEKLSLSSFCFQVMKFKDSWMVTDINARLGAGTSMSFACGMDFFGAMFAILWNEDPSVFFRPLKRETFVTRQYIDLQMNM